MLHDRYWAGVARNRPKEYWLWGNLAALVFSAGPMVGAGLTTLGRQGPRPRRRARRGPRDPVARRRHRC